jgi:hypothetical protein
MDAPLVDKSEEIGTFRTVLLKFIFFCTSTSRVKEPETAVAFPPLACCGDAPYSTPPGMSTSATNLVSLGKENTWFNTGQCISAVFQTADSLRTLG